MKKIIALCALQLFNISLIAQSCKEVVGYYPNWQWYDRNKLVNPQSLFYSKYSFINYCFFKPETNGDISNTDSWADENLLQGQINWSTTPYSYYPNTSVIDLAHQSSCKVMVSVGGWTLSDNFPTIAASSSLRTHFASECCRLIRFYHFDGIDIDWEYPGFTEHSGTTSDKQNFTLLLQEIRDSINSQGLADGKNYYLSACFSADPMKAQDIEWNNVSQILDMINVMTYDFFGAWDCLANHNSPLFAPTSGDPSFNINSAFQMLTTTHAVDPGKINLGVAFYGRSQMGATGLHQATNCTANTALFSEDDGTPLYYNVMKNMASFDRYWDSDAAVPYLLGISGGNADGTFVSYDDGVSVAKKAQYVKDNNARGVIIWEITGDYMETSVGSGIVAGTPLLDTINYVFCNSTSSLKGLEETLPKLFPNPCTTTFTIYYDRNEAEIKIYDALGRLQKETETTNGIVNVSEFSPGIYQVQVISGSHSFNVKLVKE